jgi:hypothetical protein
MPSRRTRLALRVAGFAVVVAVSTRLAGCAPQQMAPGSVGDATTITEAEIDSAHVSTAYDVIHKLRPQLLISRGKLSLDPTALPALPRVYVDDQFYGDATSLRGILAGTIESIRYYSAAAAQYKYGHDNAAGVIAIATKH